MTLSGKARVAGVMGWPVGHSRSPRIHGYWLQRYGVDGAYVPLPVRPDDLRAAVAGLRALGFRGANVTVPHKEAVRDLCDRLDRTAERIGAVNTLVIAGDGEIAGFNTDGIGFMEYLRSRTSWNGGIAVVLGAGGAARAVAASLLDAGAIEVRIVNRTAARASALADALGNGAVAVPWTGREAALAGVSLLVNTTVLGMTGQPPLDLRLDELPLTAAVNDIVYAPLVTPLLARAQARGNAVVDGLGMLLHQARPGFAAWFGVEPAVDEALRQFVLAPVDRT